MSKIPLNTPGHVYIMTSATLSQAGLIKIGASTGDPDIRAKQLSASTSSPTPFSVLYSRPVSDVNAAEAEMHRIFAHARVNDGREYFKISLSEAVRALDILCGDYRPQPPTPMAELFASFPDDGEPRDLTPEEQAKCRALEKA